MPKIHGTRKEKAKELLLMATDGPSFSLGFPHNSPERDKYLKMASEDYRLWSKQLDHSQAERIDTGTEGKVIWAARKKE